MLEYGLIGKRLLHSFSKNFFTKFFNTNHIDANYELFPLESISKFPDLLREHPNLAGINVTIPYKQSVIPFLDKLSPEAENIGSVNVIKITRDSDRILTVGYNTDCIGFRQSIESFIPDKATHAIVLGSGGASKAAAYVLRAMGVRTLIVSRSPHPGNDCLAYADLAKGNLLSHAVIVNATPLGMYPDIESCPPIPYSNISSDSFCYDMVYNPGFTEFMKRCAMQGAAVKNGLEMLHRQAVASWQIWSDK
ncbi:MAG: shikimate dehydrogenase [Candidatus Amulumruptor caecigallinarius]|nr:shikimate dehydrogenase [Candidatus Amulumruptor caecigallinarius]